MAEQNASLPPIHLPVTDGKGQITQAWYRHFEAVFNRTGGWSGDKVEAANQTGRSAVAAANAAAAQAAAAQNTANSGAGGGGAQTQGASTLMGTSGTAWSPGPVVSFPSAVAVTHETFANCSIDGGFVTGMGNSLRTFNGEARIVRAIGGVETVVEMVAFTVGYLPGSTYEPPDTTVSFSGFSHDSSDANTGLVDYRLDLRRASGSGDFGDTTASIQVQRTP